MAEPIIFPTDSRFKNLTGQTFGRLTVVSYAGRGTDNRNVWLCRCSCGENRVIPTHNLTRGNSRSCGCLNRATLLALSTKHGMAKSAEFRSWTHAKARCANPEDKSYPQYGGRGISMCARWLESFQNFFADMGPKPSKLHSLDRINNNGNYEPGNCRWATRTTQNRNTRKNTFITHDGETLTIAEWSKKTGIPNSTIINRMNGNSNVPLFADATRDGKKSTKIEE